MALVQDTVSHASYESQLQDKATIRVAHSSQFPSVVSITTVERLKPEDEESRSVAVTFAKLTKSELRELIESLQELETLMVDEEKDGRD